MLPSYKYFQSIREKKRMVFSWLTSCYDKGGHVASTARVFRTRLQEAVKCLTADRCHLMFVPLHCPTWRRKARIKTGLSGLNNPSKLNSSRLSKWVKPSDFGVTSSDRMGLVDDIPQGGGRSGNSSESWTWTKALLSSCFISAFSGIAALVCPFSWSPNHQHKWSQHTIKQHN